MHLHLIYAIVVTVRERETEMAPMTASIETTASPIEHCQALPTNRGEWTPGAQNAYREVLGELDAWSRRLDSSKSLNSWIAEEAIRQSW